HGVVFEPLSFVCDCFHAVTGAVKSRSTIAWSRPRAAAPNLRTFCAPIRRGKYPHGCGVSTRKTRPERNETKRNETKLRSFIFHRHRWAWQNCNRVVTRWFVKRPTLRRDARFALLGKWIGPLGKFILM